MVEGEKKKNLTILEIFREENCTLTQLESTNVKSAWQNCEAKTLELSFPMQCQSIHFDSNIHSKELYFSLAK